MATCVAPHTTASSSTTTTPATPTKGGTRFPSLIKSVANSGERVGPYGVRSLFFFHFCVSREFLRPLPFPVCIQPPNHKSQNAFIILYVLVRTLIAVSLYSLLQFQIIRIETTSKHPRRKVRHGSAGAFVVVLSLPHHSGGGFIHRNNDEGCAMISLPCHTSCLLTQHGVVNFSSDFLEHQGYCMPSTTPQSSESALHCGVLFPLCQSERGEFRASLVDIFWRVSLCIWIGFVGPWCIAWVPGRGGTRSYGCRGQSMNIENTEVARLYTNHW